MRIDRLTPPLLLLALAAPAAVAQETPDGLLTHALRVSGTAEVSLVPDRVSFTVGVETTAAQVADAVEQNNQRARAVIDALVAAGVDKTRIRTTSLSLQPQYEHREGRTPQIVGYHASNSVTVTSDRTAEVGKLLQAAINAGANQVLQLAYTASKPGKARDDGLAAAFADARSKAEVLARAAGRTLGQALSIVEGSLPPPRPLFMERNVMAAAVSDVPAEPGMLETSVTVTVVFELGP
jgi:uncharacterized protein YggE